MPLPNRLCRALCSLVLSGFLAIGASACSGVPEGDGALGAAQQAQIDPGLKDYVLYTLTDDAGDVLGYVLVTATANATYGFLANYEYWYLNTNLSNSSAVTFTGSPSMSWAAPVCPGCPELSFATQRSSSWSSGYMVGSLLLDHNPLNGTVIGLNWGMSNAGGLWTGQMNWYHNTATSVLGPSTTTRLAPGSYTSSEYYIISKPTS